MGGQFNTAMLDIKNHMSTSAQTAQKQTQLQIQQSQMVSTVSPAIEPLSAAGQSKADTIQTISGDPRQTTQIISTLGANGATDLLADKIGTLSAQWLADGKITETQANLLAKLSNQGHQLATYEKLLSDALMEGSTHMIVDGKTYSTTGGLGFFTTSGSDVLELNPDAANPLLRPFAETYQKFLATKNSLDPAVSKEITTLAMQISAVDDALKWSAEDIADGRINQPATSDTSLWSAVSDRYERTLNESPTPIQASTDTRNITSYNSKQVCTRGGGNYNGNSCAP